MLVGSREYLLKCFHEEGGGGCRRGPRAHRGCRLLIRGAAELRGVNVPREGGTAIPESLAITGSLSERALLGEAVTLSALLSLQDVPGASVVATGERGSLPRPPRAGQLNQTACVIARGRRQSPCLNEASYCAACCLICCQASNRSVVNVVFSFFFLWSPQAVRTDSRNNPAATDVTGWNNQDSNQW